MLARVEVGLPAGEDGLRVAGLPLSAHKTHCRQSVAAIQDAGEAERRMISWMAAFAQSFTSLLLDSSPA